MSNADQVVRDFAAAWGRGDVDTILDTFTEDAVYHNIPMDPLNGKEEIRAFLGSFVNDGIDFDILHQVVDGNIVMNERIDTLAMGETTVALKVMGIFELEGDKIKGWRDYFDMAPFTGG